MADPWKIKWRHRVRHCRLLVWLKFAIRTGNWKPFWFTVRDPSDWFQLGSGLDR
jgi:hypothetical protein